MKRPPRFKSISKEHRLKVEADIAKYEELRKYRHENYRVDRMRYADSDERTSDKYDKAIITLSSGAFGLTATLITKIFTPLAATTSDYIMAALFGFGASMVSTLLSFLFGNWATTRQIKHLDNHQLSGDWERSPKTTRLRYFIHIFNVASFVFFVIGAVCIILFVKKNLSK